MGETVFLGEEHTNFLFIQYQMVSPEHKQTSSRLHLETYMYTYASRHITAINKSKGAMNLKEDREGFMGVVGERKEKGK